MYEYNISGSYLSTDAKGICTRKYFNEDVKAKDNVEAMKKVVGNFAWNESDEGNTFLLERIHYECL